MTEAEEKSESIIEQSTVVLAKANRILGARRPAAIARDRDLVTEAEAAVAVWQEWRSECYPGLASAIAAGMRLEEATYRAVQSLGSARLYSSDAVKGSYTDGVSADLRAHLLGQVPRLAKAVNLPNGAVPTLGTLRAIWSYKRDSDEALASDRREMTVLNDRIIELERENEQLKAQLAAAE